MKYVCIRHKYCKHREECGGAKPHEFDENECGKCPMDKSAKCMEENMLAMMMSEDDSFSRFLYKETIKDLGADIDTKKCFKEYYSEFTPVDDSLEQILPVSKYYPSYAMDADAFQEDADIFLRTGLIEERIDVATVLIG